jgi:hypothetical protein
LKVLGLINYIVGSIVLYLVIVNYFNMENKLKELNNRKGAK